MQPRRDEGPRRSRRKPTFLFFVSSRSWQSLSSLLSSVSKCNHEETKVREDHEENRRFSSLCLRGPGSRYRPCCRACPNATTKRRRSTKITKKTDVSLLLCLRGPGSRYRPCCRACPNATTKRRSSTKITKKTIAVLLRGASGSSCPCGPGRVVA